MFNNHRVQCLQREPDLISQKLQSALTFGPSAPTSPTRPGGPGSPWVDEKVCEAIWSNMFLVMVQKVEQIPCTSKWKASLCSTVQLGEEIF